MAEQDKSSKTEQPTGKKLQDSMEEGTFPKSAEIGVAFGLASSFLVLLFAAPSIGEHVSEITAYILGHLSNYRITESGITYWTITSTLALFKLAIPILGAGFLAAIIAGGLQTGFRMTPKVLGFKIENLNPVSGFKRVVSAQVAVQMGIDFLKLIAISWIVYGAVKKTLNDPIFYAPVDIGHVAQFILDTTLYVLSRLLIASIIIAAISYSYQFRKVRKDLMMTKQEVKDELKNQEGDPKVKNALRMMAFRLLRKQMLSSIATADVVVTNPTHYAVALKYEKGVDKAPVVLAKGENAFARRIKEIARENEVPIVENKPVARTLYKYGRVGKEIPVQLYQAVAEILSFVYRTHRYYFHRLKTRRLNAATKKS